MLRRRKLSFFLFRRSLTIGDKKKTKKNILEEKSSYTKSTHGGREGWRGGRAYGKTVTYFKIGTFRKGR